MARLDPLGLLFPKKCVLCGRLLTPQEFDLCGDCELNAPCFSGRDRKIPYISDYTALWRYEGQVRSALLRYKFYGKRHYGAVFGRLLARKLSRENWMDFDCVVYVPVSRRRKLLRGYDQVQLIARTTGKTLGVRTFRVLKKVRHNVAQSSLKDSGSRWENVKDAYRVTRPEVIFGKRVLLIDDIITTGATISECAQMLLASGARQVVCGVVAAGEGRNR